MTTGQIVFLVISLVAVAILVGLYFLGKKMDKKNAEQQEMMRQNSQVVSMLIIDKKKMKITEAGLPQIVIDQTPKYLRRSKVPVVKAKVGNRILVMMAEADAYEVLPVKCEAKVVISGIYIREVKSVRGQTIQKPEQKKKFWDRFKRKNKNK